jgi:hypothetical protein
VAVGESGLGDGAESIVDGMSWTGGIGWSSEVSLVFSVLALLKGPCDEGRTKAETFKGRTSRGAPAANERAKSFSLGGPIEMLRSAQSGQFVRLPLQWGCSSKTPVDMPTVPSVPPPLRTSFRSFSSARLKAHITQQRPDHLPIPDDPK